MAETGGGESTSTVSKAYSASTINIYMKGFLSHTFSDEVNFRVQEKLQRIMMMTPNVENEGIFYIDIDSSYFFCELLFSRLVSNAGSLFIFEVFFFTVADWHSQK